MTRRKTHDSAKTELQETGKELDEIDCQFQLMVENSLDGFLIVDDNFRFIYANGELSNILGYSGKEIVGEDLRRFLDQGSKSLVQELNTRRQRGEEAPSRYEATIIRKNGERRIVEIKASTLSNSQHKLLTVAHLLDITEQKKMEENRARFEDCLSALNTYAQSLNMARTLDEIFTLTLNCMEKTLGFEHAAFMIVDRNSLKVARQRGYPTPLLMELPLDGSSKGITVRAARTHTPILVPDTEKDRDYVEGIAGIRSELAVPLEKDGCTLGVLNVESSKTGAFDIRDMQLLQTLASHAATAISSLRKRKEIEIRSAQLASLMKSSTKMIGSANLHQRLQTIADAITELGWRRVVISVRDQKMEIASREDIVTAGLSDSDREFLWEKRPPGHVWKERFGSEYDRFRIGEFYHLPWSDPWVRKKFADSTIPSNLPSEEMVDWNPQDLLYAPLRLADGRIVGILSIDDPIEGKRPTKESLSPMELFLHQAAVAIENAQLILRLNRAKEQLRSDAELLELKVEERTEELRRSQQQLLKTQRLAAIGELAGMIGHDLRNPLTGIAGATYYLRTKLDNKGNKKTKDMLLLIEGNVEYANKIIDDLLEYSREMQLELTWTTPKAICEKALSIIRIPKNIKLTDLTRDTPRICVDVEKMRRALLNVVKNAIEAMPEGGEITIKSKRSNRNIKISIADTGIGMSDETLEKIWTTLFTTKAKGMGLGLAICRRITDAHKGKILVHSKAGKGTTLTISVPLRPQLKGGEEDWIQAREYSLSTMMKA
ncbi:MAG: GAF domain-containing protein [Candidatus Bathyarchaeota archaeon]|nr:MAG: GAF domain-containing protein [Candidatus Bathyarchaeota archaeon]